METKDVLYLCNGERLCRHKEGHCVYYGGGKDGCAHTADIEFAKNFYKVGDVYAEIKPDS